MSESSSDQPVRIHVTAQRRADDIESSLSRKGIQVFHCPSIITTPVLEDEDLPGITRRIIESPPDLVIVTTGVGLRGWLAAADQAGLKEPLLGALRGARFLARGAKANGAILAEGLNVEWVSQKETADDVARYLEGEDLTGTKAVVQHHGMGADGLDDVVRSLGAEVTPVVTYKYAESADSDAIRRSIIDATTGERVGVLFTSAGGAEAWMRHVSAQEREALRRLSADATTGLFAVGSVTAQPLLDAGLTAIVPQRFRLGALLKRVAMWAESFPEASLGETTS
ncbi:MULTISPECIES: uroporphyrinogen-III synthase [Micrococcaceae]|uniref:uroporphyrinogen-III synthase n=1 Tax=unclassified Kocuria TaxID=2649579 RepID=UPI0013EDAD6E|nr:MULTISPECIES: uroporphyrinogen-III synthase [unclassified Kocuria]